MPDIHRFSRAVEGAPEGGESWGEQPSVQRRWGWVLGSGALVLVAVVAALKLSTGSVFGLWASQSTWQAVFLSNSTVYFGQVASYRGQWLEMHDIYYLQRAQTPQPSGGVEDQPGEGKLVLIKLGNELHGPQDSMRINREHVVFIEDLKPDSQVVKAIDNYLQAQAAAR